MVVWPPASASVRSMWTQLNKEDKRPDKSYAILGHSQKWMTLQSDSLSHSLAAQQFRELEHGLIFVTIIHQVGALPCNKLNLASTNWGYHWNKLSLSSERTKHTKKIISKTGTYPSSSATPKTIPCTTRCLIIQAQFVHGTSFLQQCNLELFLASQSEAAINSTGIRSWNCK